MGSCLVTLRSETYSQMVGKLLRERGITSTVVKLGGEFSSKGCGHGVRFDCGRRAEVLKILKENGVPFSDVKAL